MAPLPCSRMCRSSCFMQAQTPRRFTEFTRSNVSAASWAASDGGGLDTGVVRGHVQPAEGCDGLVDQGGDLFLV